jgi:hypothetical protein
MRMYQSEVVSLEFKMSFLNTSISNLSSEITSLDNQTSDIKSENKILCEKIMEFLSKNHHNDVSRMQIVNNMQALANCLELQKKEHTILIDKLKFLSERKANIINSNKNRLIKLENKINTLSTLMDLPKSFKNTKKEYFNSSPELFETLKYLIQLQKDKFSILKENISVIRGELVNAENHNNSKRGLIKMELQKLFSNISMNYLDIRINNFMENMTHLELCSQIQNVNIQLQNKIRQATLTSEMYEDDTINCKNKINKYAEKIEDKMQLRDERKLKKKYFS